MGQNPCITIFSITIFQFNDGNVVDQAQNFSIYNNKINTVSQTTGNGIKCQQCNKTNVYYINNILKGSVGVVSDLFKLFFLYYN